MDMANHASSANEVEGGYMGTFGTLAGSVFKTSSKLAAGQEVFASYGPKSAADYLLEHGFVPDDGTMRATAEITAELDADALFRDDKLDILEFETGAEVGSMEPTQTFDVDDSGEPDFALLQFMRLVKLGGTDAFLLESIFRQEVWGFMELPVSVSNERAALTSLRSLCEGHLQDMAVVEEKQPQDDSSSTSTTLTKQQVQCKRVRDLERLALQRTTDYLQRDVEALDLKEYYQERRLKDLGLDSEWSDNDDSDEDDLGDFPAPTKRVPGGADYDF
jgi:[ribulose-bisphosphate carboxylase]-lysine N-methyltransferase